MISSPLRILLLELQQFFTRKPFLSETKKNCKQFSFLPKFMKSFIIILLSSVWSRCCSECFFSWNLMLSILGSTEKLRFHKIYVQSSDACRYWCSKPTFVTFEPQTIFPWFYLPSQERFEKKNHFANLKAIHFEWNANPTLNIYVRVLSQWCHSMYCYVKIIETKKNCHRSDVVILSYRGSYVHQIYTLKHKNTKSDPIMFYFILIFCSIPFLYNWNLFITK